MTIHDRPLLLPAYSQYKPSRVLWLDEIPAHWDDLPIKRLATFKSGAGFPIAEQGRQGLELPFYKVSDMNLPGNEKIMKTENNTVSRNIAAKLKAHIFPQGTIIFPKVGGAMLTNKRRVLERPSCIDNNLMACIVSHGDPNFVFFLLQNTDFALIANPGPVPSINEREVRNIRVPLPPLDEQAAIARYLTHKDALIQRYLHAQRRLLASLQQLRKSTIHYTVIQGLDPKNTPTKPSRVPWLDEIPAHWDDLPIKRLATFKSGAGFPIAEQGRQGLELPFYKVSDMNLPGNEKIMKTENNTVSQSTAAKLKAHIFPQGTIIFPKVGGAMLTNKRRVLERPSCIDNNLMGCIVNHGDPNFVFFLLQNTDFALIANPGPVPSINEREVRNIRVPYPPVEEQVAIAEYLDERVAKIDAAIAGTSRLIDLMGQYRASLIHEVVTGARDVRKAAAGIPEGRMDSRLRGNDVGVCGNDVGVCGNDVDGVRE